MQVGEQFVEDAADISAERRLELPPRATAAPTGETSNENWNTHASPEATYGASAGQLGSSAWIEPDASRYDVGGCRPLRDAPRLWLVCVQRSREARRLPGRA